MKVKFAAPKNKDVLQKKKKEASTPQISTRDLMHMFVRDLRKDETSQEVLSKGGVALLIRKIRKKNRGSLSARNTLIVHNIRLVISIAKRYANMGISLNDLVNEGVFGLITAIEKFKPGKKFMFSTYATHWIRQSVCRAVSNQNSNHS